MTFIDTSGCLQVLTDKNSDKKSKEEAADHLRVFKLNREDDYRQSVVTNHLNYTTMILVFLITVINMFITGFGIKLDISD